MLRLMCCLWAVLSASDHWSEVLQVLLSAVFFPPLFSAYFQIKFVTSLWQTAQNSPLLLFLWQYIIILYSQCVTPVHCNRYAENIVFATRSSRSMPKGNWDEVSRHYTSETWYYSPYHCAWYLKRKVSKMVWYKSVRLDSWIINTCVLYWTELCPLVDTQP